MSIAIIGSAVALGAALVRSSDAKPPGRVVFDGDFARGLAVWSVAIHRERITVGNDPVLGAKRKVARMTVLDTDTGPTANPRAQLESKSLLVEPKDYWIGWSTLFPRAFPVLPPGGWLSFEGVYGPPAQGAGPLATRVSGNTIRFQRNETYDYDVPWSTPLVRGRWLDFVVHVKLSHDADEGYVELWLNSGHGWRQQRLAGRKRLYMQTLDATNGDGPNSFRLGNYRKRGMFDTVTLYQASPKIGRSFDAVKPDSYGD